MSQTIRAALAALLLVLLPAALYAQETGVTHFSTGESADLPPSPAPAQVPAPSPEQPQAAQPGAMQGETPGQAAPAAQAPGLVQAPPTSAEGEGGAYVQLVNDGRIDWQAGMITATGTGAPPPYVSSPAQGRAMAVRAAEIVARRNLLETVRGVRVDADEAVGEAMAHNRTVRSRLDGELQNSRILETNDLPDGSVQVRVGMSMRGRFADAVLPRSVMTGAVSVPAALPAQTPPAAFPVAQAPAASAPQATGQGPAQSSAAGQAAEEQAAPKSAAAWTGLVVDATGVDADPAMVVRIVDEEGRPVYGPSGVDRRVVAEQGMAAYAKNMDEAMHNPRVAGNPLYVKAVRADGPHGTTLVLTDADATTLRDAAARRDILGKCRVIVVLK
ncbi:putative Lipoprotein LPP20 [Desulfovibrio sp. X2]|uniref:hypothetical protein n=1 Tax=Desulfovibrio sp. X2 TaxID=941449 RepID=UPI00035888AF|nr:hypothetical protein [Desulfovibrio sp. X2]EPR44061.1 putative Lipoprotein LPP20 [Desulfovibrio sp. X2]